MCVCVTECDIPRGAAPHVPLVHPVRHLPLLPVQEPRDGLQHLQHLHAVPHPAHHHRAVLLPHPAPDEPQGQTHKLR